MASKTKKIQFLVHKAARKGDHNHLLYLLGLKHSKWFLHINVLDNHGAYPLYYAVYNKHPKAVRILVDNGANVNANGPIANGWMEYPIHAACFNGMYKTVKLLVEKGADIHVKDERGYNSLLFACYRGNMTIVKYLIELGINI